MDYHFVCDNRSTSLVSIALVLWARLKMKMKKKQLRPANWGRSSRALGGKGKKSKIKLTCCEVKVNNKIFVRFL